MTGPPDLEINPDTGTRFRDALEGRLAEFLDEQARSAVSLQLSELWRQIAASMRGGKRIRPQLVNLGFQACGGGYDLGQAVDVGCAFELLHSGLVAHDDVIDRDFVRRGRPTLSAHYRDAASLCGQGSEEADQVGNAAAIIAGDLLISQSVQMVHGIDTARSVRQGVIEVFQEAIVHSAAGELDDVLLSADMVATDLDHVLRMHHLKTASYSFESPLRAGALLAGASACLADRVAGMGSHLGIAYQIIDDVLGTFGDPATTGKPNDSDLREGKSTVVIAIAQRMPEFDQVLCEWRAGSLGSDQIRIQLELHGLEEQARELATAYCRAAHDRLDSLPITEGARHSLRHFIDGALNRSA